MKDAGAQWAHCHAEEAECEREHDRSFATRSTAELEAGPAGCKCCRSAVAKARVQTAQTVSPTAAACGLGLGFHVVSAQISNLKRDNISPSERFAGSCIALPDLIKKTGALCSWNLIKCSNTSNRENVSLGEKSAARLRSQFRKFECFGESQSIQAQGSTLIKRVHDRCIANPIQLEGYLFAFTTDMSVIMFAKDSRHSGRSHFHSRYSEMTSTRRLSGSQRQRGSRENRVYRLQP